MAKFKKLDLGTQEQQMDALNLLIQNIGQADHFSEEKKQAALDFMAKHQKKLLNKLVQGNVKTGHDLTEEERIKMVSIFGMVKNDKIPNNRYRFDQMKKRVTIASSKIQARKEATELPKQAVQDLENGIATVLAQEFGPQKPKAQKPAFLSGGPSLIQMGPEARLLMPSKQPAQTLDSVSGKPLLLTNAYRVDENDNGTVIEGTATEIFASNDDRVYSTQDGLKSTSSFFSVKKVAGIVLAAAIGLAASFLGDFDKEQVQTSSFTPEVSETVMASVIDGGKTTQVQFAFVDNTDITTPTPTVTDTAEPTMASVTSDDTPSENIVADTTTVETETITVEPEVTNSVFNDNAAVQQAEATEDANETVNIETASIEPLDTNVPETTADTNVAEAAEEVTAANTATETAPEPVMEQAVVTPAPVAVETTPTITSMADSIINQFNGNVPSQIAEYRSQIDNVKHAFDTSAPGYAEIDMNYDAMRVQMMAAEAAKHLEGEQAFDTVTNVLDNLATGDFGRAAAIAAQDLQATEWLPKQFGLNTGERGAVTVSMRPMPAPRG